MSVAKDERNESKEEVPEDDEQVSSRSSSSSGSESDESGPRKPNSSSSSSSPTTRESGEKPGDGESAKESGSHGEKMQRDEEESAKSPSESLQNIKQQGFSSTSSRKALQDGVGKYTSSSGETSEGVKANLSSRSRPKSGSSKVDGGEGERSGSRNNSSSASSKGRAKKIESSTAKGSSTSVEGSNEQSSSPHDLLLPTQHQSVDNEEQPPTAAATNDPSSDEYLRQETERQTLPPVKSHTVSSGGNKNGHKKAGISNSVEKGAKLAGQGHASTKIPTRLGVPLVGPPFESGANTECIQLLRQLWNVHEEAVGFLKKVRSLLSCFRQELRSQENAFETSLRGKRHSTTPSIPSSKASDSNKPKKHESTSPVGGGGMTPSTSYTTGFPTDPGENLQQHKNEWWAALPSLVEGLGCIYDNFADIEKQFLSLSVFQTQCKLALLAKVKNAKHQLTHDRLSIMHGVQQLITVTLQLISTPSLWSDTHDQTPVYVQNVFHLTEVFNGCVESSWSSIPMEAALAASSIPPPATTKNPSGSLTSITQSEPDETKGGSSSNGGGGGGGSSGGPPDSSKPSTLPNRLRILIQINAANRNDTALLRLSLKPLSATRLLQLVARKRSTFASHTFSRLTMANFHPSSSSPSPGEPTTDLLNVDKYESCFTDEDSGLSPFGKGFSQCPSLLGRAAVKKTENGDQRLSRSARTKMYSYFHQVLWTLAGEHSEDLLLWGIHSNTLPLFLQPLHVFVSLRNSLTLGQQFQESHLSPMLSAFDSVGGALHSFTLLANWDEKIREAFEKTHRVKRPEQVALVSKPTPAQWATEIGSKFGQIVTTCISLIDGGGNGNKNVMRSMIPPPAMRLSDEEHLGDEAQTLFRLEATLIYFKTWVVKRSKVWLNAWAIPQFLAFSQREPALLVKLIKSREPLLITRDFLLNNDNVSVRLIAKHRQACANDLRTALLQLQTMPDEMLQAVGPVCNTLSLATLQSYMPPATHWRGVGRTSGLDPDKPSSYIKIFIDRVIEPVITASVELVPGPVQEAMGKQTVHAACDAWLEYILQRKIKFSEWGAVQLLRDFTAFREWIRTETELEKDARRAILQLEVLRRCEGVAYLLLRNPGDVLGVGKPSRKNRRIAPSSSGSVDSSPSAADSTADDDIPPEMYVPNQQMWLELRLRRSMFTSPCCQ